MSETFTGKVWVLGDDIDTDIIIPTEYLALKTVQDMAPYAFSPLRPELASAPPGSRLRKSSRLWASAVSLPVPLPGSFSAILSTTDFCSLKTRPFETM